MLWVLAIPLSGIAAFGVYDEILLRTENMYEWLFVLLALVPLLVALILHKAFDWVFAEDWMVSKNLEKRVKLSVVI